MAIEIEESKKSNLGVVVFLLVILLAAGWLVWNFLKPVEIIKKPKIEDILSPSSKELIEAKLDIGKITNHPVFQTLAPHTAWPPPETPNLGKVNPFQPF
ncbi:MAG: hypothetical protein WC042_02160 [Candidatus Paceibacterota bacterium]|jgi:hypothetical protein|nr:hypothetical protein [Candidatus Paceibacterota bacterium]MDD3548770.1 hypothetical protein [Candidatus Paceibacterota bacterium]MDD4999249.1 hypothetical protein [Candidatus Paceibacterota bacterium]MDD5545393.1 hypothetical protein [Candidatus Paceibacterota bacterium]